MILENETLENNVEIEENAGRQCFLLFPQCFLPFPKQISILESHLLCVSKYLQFGHESSFVAC